MSTSGRLLSGHSGGHHRREISPPEASASPTRGGGVEPVRGETEEARPLERPPADATAPLEGRDLRTAVSPMGDDHDRASTSPTVSRGVHPSPSRLPDDDDDDAIDDDDDDRLFPHLRVRTLGVEPPGTPSSSGASPAAAKLVRAASVSPGGSPRVSLDGRPETPSARSPSSLSAGASYPGAAAPPRPPPARPHDDAMDAVDATTEDVAEEVDALVAAATERGVSAAARTLAEAMSTAVEGAERGAEESQRAVDAMADALADALLRRIMPSGEAERASTRTADAGRPCADADADYVDDEGIVELSAPSAMCNPRAVLLAAQLVGMMPRENETWTTRGDLEDGAGAAPAEAPDPGSPGAGPRLRLLRGLLHALRAHMCNCLDASRAGALVPLLRVLAEAAADDPLRPDAPPSSVDDEPPVLGHRDEEARRVAEACVVEMAGHTLSVGNLRAWLRIAAEARGTARGALVRALDAALRSPRSGGPASFFALDGEGSGVLGASGARSNSHSGFGSGSGSNSSSGWPFNDRGFAFVTWVYLESLRGSETAAAAAAEIAAAAATAAGGRAGQRQSPAAAAAAAAAAAGDAQEHMPRLFSFVSTEHGGKQGVEAYFHGRYLVLEATGENGARASAPFAAPIQLKRWTCVAVEYRPGVAVGGGSSSSASTAAAGEARLYVDGVLAESHPVSLPRVRGSLGFCCVGTNPPAAMAGVQSRRRQCALYGALGPAYVFREAVGARRVAELTARGGSYVPGYGDVNPPLDPASIESEARRTDFHSRSIDRIGRSVDPGDGTGAGVGAGGRVFRGFRAAARAVAAAAAGKPTRAADPGSPSAGTTTASDVNAPRRASSANADAGVSSTSTSIAATIDRDWRALDDALAPALLQLLHPATVPGSGSRARRVPDISPLGGGGLGDRRGSTLGNARCARRTPPGDAMLAVAPGGAACAFALACASVCARTRRPSPVPPPDFNHLERRLRKKLASPRRFEPSADPS